MTIISESQPTQRNLAGADLVGLTEQVAEKLKKEAEDYLDLSNSLGFTMAN